MDIPSWAIKGAKVVCVESGWNLAGNDIAPVKGETYTIRGIKDFAHFGIGITLKEIKNRWRRALMDSGECHFVITGFRPLQYPKRELSEDIALFNKLLIPTPKIKRLVDIEARQDAILTRLDILDQRLAADWSRGGAV